MINRSYKNNDYFSSYRNQNDFPCVRMKSFQQPQKLSWFEIGVEWMVRILILHASN